MNLLRASFSAGLLEATHGAARRGGPTFLCTSKEVLLNSRMAGQEGLCGEQHHACTPKEPSRQAQKPETKARPLDTPKAHTGDGLRWPSPQPLSRRERGLNRPHRQKNAGVWSEAMTEVPVRPESKRQNHDTHSGTGLA